MAFQYQNEFNKSYIQDLPRLSNERDVSGLRKKEKKISLLKSLHTSFSKTTVLPAILQSCTPPRSLAQASFESIKSNLLHGYRMASLAIHMFTKINTFKLDMHFFLFLSF